ncbi:MAG TPA: DUF4267 domain-containing protein [Pseudonocardiaceae bacterium]|jgi:hypothetical protein|nr:DUF4267 domain-containing protein [Pseudonocardiaceae bacterium]
MSIAATVLTALLGVTVVWIGLRFLLMPEPAAAAYGVPASAEGDASAYLSIKGVRDGSLGVLTLVLLLTAPHAVIGWFLLAVALIPFGDMVIVLRHHGSKVLAYAMHGGTGVLAVAIAVLQFLG